MLPETEISIQESFVKTYKILQDKYRCMMHLRHIHLIIDVEDIIVYIDIQIHLEIILQR